MIKDWQKDQLHERRSYKELGVGQMVIKQVVILSKLLILESQVVTVRGTKRMRADKKPVKATWY